MNQNEVFEEKSNLNKRLLRSFFLNLVGLGVSIGSTAEALTSENRWIEIPCIMFTASGVATSLIQSMEFKYLLSSRHNLKIIEEGQVINGNEPSQNLNNFKQTPPSE